MTEPARHPGSLLTIDALPISEVSSILSLTARLAQMPAAQRASVLTARRIALLFYESSTRTRTSFELAAKSLGATTTLVSDKSSSIEKGESPQRTPVSPSAPSAPSASSSATPPPDRPSSSPHATGLPILNAGDGTAQHPSQALLDLRTILTRLQLDPTAVHEKSLSGLTITITRRYPPLPRSRSNAMLLPRLGARVILCGPEQLLPQAAEGLSDGVEITRDFNSALSQSQIVMMLRIQKERPGRPRARPRRIHRKLPAQPRTPRHPRPQSTRPAPRPHGPRPRDHRRSSRWPPVRPSSNK